MTKKRRTHEEFLKELYDKNEHYRNGYLKILEKYKGHGKLILVEDKYGKLAARPARLLKGFKPTIVCSVNKTTYFINKAKEVHGDLYDYSKVVYTGANKKICIIDPVYGKFWQTATVHLRGSGCTPRVRRNASYTLDTKGFILKAKDIHGSLYDYSKVDYQIGTIKVPIGCSKHGFFNQEPRIHLSGHGCPSCCFSHGWTKDGWFISGNKSKHFDSWKLYLIECWDEETGERFIKVGVSYRSVVNRYPTSSLPYKYKILKVVERKDKSSYEDMEYIYDLEYRFKRLYNNFKHNPLIKFGGSTECFIKI